MGQRVQLDELAKSLGMEAAFAKPFYALRPAFLRPNTSAFLDMGPVLENHVPMWQFERAEMARMPSLPPISAGPLPVVLPGTWPRGFWD